MSRPALLLALALLALSCRRPEGPAERYRTFAAAARAGDSDAVWGMLSARSRAALDAKAKGASAEAPKGVVPPSGKDLVIGDAASLAPRLKSVVVLRESRDEAIVGVETEAGGPRQDVTLVREGGGWRVVVPGL
jgi:hypothetical protein